VRSEATNQLIGEVTDYAKIGYVGRHNLAGNWALDMSATDPMAVYLSQPGYGLRVLRTVRSAKTRAVLASEILFSGPSTKINRKKSGNKLIVSGRDDLIRLVARQAWPVVSFPYPTAVLALPGLLRYYKLGEVGTTATLSNILSANQQGVETDTSGFTSVSGATLTRTTVEHQAGVAALQVVTPGSITNEGFGAYQPDTAYRPGATVTASVWLKGTGNVVVKFVQAGVAQLGFLNITLTGTWTQYTVPTFVLPAVLAAGNYGIEVCTRTTAQAVTFFADTLQVQVVYPTAVDSKSAQNGYYGGGYTQGQPAIADDAAKSVLFDGSTGQVFGSPTSLPTGTSSLYMGCWVYFASTPGGSPVYYGASTNASGNKNGFYFAFTSGQVQARVDPSNGTALSATLANGVPHFLGMQWDGTTLKLYIDGVLSQTATPGALSLVANVLNIGTKVGGTGWFSGEVGHVFLGSGTLTDQQWADQYALGLSRFAASAYDVRSGIAETVIRQYVDVNAISAIADPLGLSRVVPGLALTTNLGRGANVTEQARFDKLMNKDGSGLLQRLGQNGGLGFRVVQSGTALQLQLYAPTDRSATVIFSDALGTVSDFDYTWEAPDPEEGGNVAVVAGLGEGVDRTIILRADATSIGHWERSEDFQDARDTSDLATLQQRGDAALAQNAEKIAFAATIAPSDALVWGVDMDLGDKVTITVDGTSYSDLIREVQLTYEQGKGETVTPVVGTPGASVVQRAFGAFSTRLSKARARLARLESV
jgi:hypothetical protein